MKKAKEAFVSTKKRWDSTLKKSRQNVDQIGRTSQNKPVNTKKEADDMLRRGMQGKSK